MTMWLGSQPLVLASQSRARQALLENAGIPFEAIPADIDERAVAAGKPPDLARRDRRPARRGKSRLCRRAIPGRLVLGADQTLALGERGFNKPADRAQAVAQLRALSGRRHELHSAIALVRNGQSAVRRRRRSHG